MATRGSVRIATRASELARRQTGTVADRLADRNFEIELLEVETTGDRLSEELIQNLGKTGAFVRSLDEHVLEDNADLAVHSLKDVPTDQPEELVVAAIPEREQPNDVLLTPDGTSLESLPERAVVGTSSLRRNAQLNAQRGDLQVEALRGNVDTRVEKLLAPTLQAEHERLLEEASAEEGANTDEEPAPQVPDDDLEAELEGPAQEFFEELSELERRALGRDVETEYDAIVLAEAGLRRSGLATQLDYVELPTDTFVPSPGQGALAVVGHQPPDESGERSELASAVTALLDHPRSRIETTAERIVLEGVGGGCIAPIGVHGVVRGEYVHVDAQVLDVDGSETVDLSRDLPVDSYAEKARAFAETLVDRGAQELIERAKSAAPGADTRQLQREDEP